MVSMNAMVTGLRKITAILLLTTVAAWGHGLPPAGVLNSDGLPPGINPSSGGPPPGINSNNMDAGGPPPGVVTGGSPSGGIPDLSFLSQAEATRCGEIIDSHLHLASWFSTADQLNAELDNAKVDRGILYAVYGKEGVPGAADPNEDVRRIASSSGGRIFGLASLNTTGNWEKEGSKELNRLTTFLEKPEFVGTKLAPPHTCLALDSQIMRDIVERVDKGSKKVLGVHVGTTPFCGAFALALGLPQGCCERQYVDPALLEPLIVEYPEITFLLLHAGFDFLPEGDAHNYNGTLVDTAAALAATYPNVLLEVSAWHSRDTDGSFRYSGGDAALRKLVDIGLVAQNKVIWASDANHFPGILSPAVAGGVTALQVAGFSPEERCQALGGIQRKVFNLPEMQHKTDAGDHDHDSIDHDHDSENNQAKSSQGGDMDVVVVDGDDNEESAAAPVVRHSWIVLLGAVIATTWAAQHQ